MNYAYNLIPTPLPSWLEFDGRQWDTRYLTTEQLASQGWLSLVYDPDGALLGYADNPCVEEIREGQSVAVAYALASPAEEAAESLKAHQAKAHQARRARRTQAELAGFQFAGHPLDSDRDSILRIANAAASAISSLLTQQPWSTSWRCADEHDLPLDATGMLALQGALAMHGQHCHTASTAIGAEIDAAQSVAAVDAVMAAIQDDPRWPG